MCTAIPEDADPETSSMSTATLSRGAISGALYLTVHCRGTSLHKLVSRSDSFTEQGEDFNRAIGLDLRINQPSVLCAQDCSCSSHGFFGVFVEDFYHEKVS